MSKRRINKTLAALLAITLVFDSYVPCCAKAADASEDVIIEGSEFAEQTPDMFDDKLSDFMGSGADEEDEIAYFPEVLSDAEKEITDPVIAGSGEDNVISDPADGEPGARMRYQIPRKPHRAKTKKSTSTKYTGKSRHRTGMWIMILKLTTTQKSFILPRLTTTCPGISSYPGRFTMTGTNLEL